MFWRIQAGVWLAYATMLTIPWIGRYTIASMIPNKLLIAATGIAASSAIAAAHDWLVTAKTSRLTRLLGLLGACAIAGAVWNAIITIALGGSGLHRLPSLGALEGGVPQMSGAFYHALVLVAWTAGFLVLRRDESAVAPAPPFVDSNRVALRDNKRVVLLDPSEIIWIVADGDYIRVQVAREQLLLRDTMSRAERALPPEFIRIHRSTIVNAQRVREMLAQANREMVVVMSDGARHRASRTYADRLRDALAAPAKVGR